MAGGSLFTKSSKNGSQTSVFNNTEVLKESNSQPKLVPNLLDGILLPGQSIEFNQDKPPEKPKFDNYLQREQSLFIHPHQEETEKAIQKILEEIKSLIPTTEGLSSDVTNIPLINIPESNTYQLNFVDRIKNIIIDTRQNATNSSSWSESFSRRQNKRNAFWNKAKSKNGGEQYLSSGEHSASRSAN